MKRTNILAALLVALSLISTGCGTSDYVQSVQLSAVGATAGGTYNLGGVDATLQLQVNEVYHSGRTVPVTNSITWTGAPICCDAGGNPLPALEAPTPGQPGTGTVWIFPTGLMQAIAPVCTWTDLPSGTPPAIPTPPQYNWEINGYYQVTATYKGVVSNPVAVGVGSLAGNAPDGTCGPKSN